MFGLYNFMQRSQQAKRHTGINNKAAEAQNKEARATGRKVGARTSFAYQHY